MTDDTATMAAIQADVLVIGSGVAGCAAALSAAREGADVLVATKATSPDDASSDWAQGGIATARGYPAAFKQDVLEASAGTADEAAVDVLVENATAAVEDVLIETVEVPFDREDDGTLAYTREAAHSASRILHVNAETGKYIHRPFLNHLADRPDVRFVEDTAALELITHEGEVRGALLDREIATNGDASDPAGAAPEGQPVFAGATILATGGIGDAFRRTTNPAGATGDGLAMAFLAGADVADMEYVQFHPTALDATRVESADADDDFLLSEAVRGEGAHLLNGGGERFMPNYHEDAELAPRDVVARAVEREREETGVVTLDVSGMDFADHFPELAEKCRELGVDPDDGIPVAPSEHFLCGGVDVDDRGETSLDRLYAVGEVARTGVHGANRLASTSLLECLVWGLRAGEAAAGNEIVETEPPRLLDRDPALPDGFAAEKFTRLQRVMDESVGLRRDPAELERAAAHLRRLKGEVDSYLRTRTARSLYELRNATVSGLLVTRAAAGNPESVGTHFVVDSTTEGTEPAPLGD